MYKKTMVTAFGFLVVSISLLSSVPKMWGWEPGRMTGGGSIFLGANDFVQGSNPATGTQITHGFELICGPSPGEPNNLQINIHAPDGPDGRFHLEQLTSSLCYSDFDPSPPKAPISSYEGHGTGRYNGQPGYCADWRFTDKGEPGTEDEIYFLSIWNCEGDGALVVQVVTPGHTLTYGNHQAHKESGGK